MRTFQASQKRFRFEKFERVATILGFIIDTKEFISIVLSVIATIVILFSNTNKQDNAIPLLLNIKITPFHALGPWLLSAYILLGYSRSVWEKQKESKKYRDKFFDFIVYDLLVGFRNMILSVLLITFGASLN